MPRQRRLWAPGDILSIVGRGHEGRPLFATNEDRLFFLDRLKRIFVPGDVDLYAWSIPFNHYHMLIRVGDAPPGDLFLRLNTAVAMRVRRVRGDHGAALQGRYWSGRCDKEGAVLSVLSYVLGNPVHHGMVPSAAALETYPWTAYPEILELASPGIVDAGKTLALLHPDAATARAILRDAVARRVARWQAERAGSDVCEEPGCRGPRDGCALVHPARVRGGRRDAASDPGADPGADPHAAEPWRATGISKAHDERSERRARLRGAGWYPRDLVIPVCARLGADPQAVLGGGRLHAESRARAVIAHVACDGAGFTGAEVADLLGVGPGPLSRARVRGRALLAALGWSVDDVLTWSERRP